MKESLKRQRYGTGGESRQEGSIYYRLPCNCESSLWRNKFGKSSAE